MKIELTIKRKDGSRVTMPNFGGLPSTYHFKPDATGAHVAEVVDAEHIARFLSIPQYKPYGEIGASDVAAIQITGISQAAAVVTDQTERGPVIEAAAGERADSDSEIDPMSLEHMDRVMLLDAHVLIFGDKAHPKIKLETLQAKIAEEIRDSADAAEKFEAFAIEQARKFAA